MSQLISTIIPPQETEVLTELTAIPFLPSLVSKKHWLIKVSSVCNPWYYKIDFLVCWEMIVIVSTITYLIVNEYLTGIYKK